MNPSDQRSTIVTGGRILATNGHSDMVWGHLSARDRGGRGIWIKRAGLGFEELSIDDIQLVGWDGALLEGSGPVHLESHIHLEVMRSRGDVHAVVHSHPESAVVLGATGLPLLPIGHEATFFVPEDVPRFVETGDLIRTSALGAAVARSLGEHNALLLVNHGIVVAETSVERAVFGAILLERAARMTLASVSARGGTEGLTVSSDAEAVSKRANCYADRQVAHGWDYLARTTQNDQRERSHT